MGWIDGKDFEFAEQNKNKNHQKLMPTYEPADDQVIDLAKEILNRFESHAPLLKYKVKFDFVFAHPTVDENGEAHGDAIKKNGVKALGLCRIINLKDRTMGRGDVEILLDFDWWHEEANQSEQAALLDHELHHAEVKIKDGQPKLDNLGRPLIRLRKHDAEFGWFDIIALRHGKFSQERIQAKKLSDEVGQLYWPDLCGPVAQALKEKVLAPFQVAPPRKSKSITDQNNDDAMTP